MSTPKKPAKTKKTVLALAAYNKFLPKKDSLAKREFRKLVTEEMKKTMDIENPGTVGMYFSWAEKQITGRPTKVYSRGDGARRKGPKVDDKTNNELNKLSAQFGAVARAKKNENTEEVSSDTTGGFAPRGFGAASL